MNSLPKAVTRQRRDCDLNPGPSAPESSKLTTRLLSHPRYGQRTNYCIALSALSYWQIQVILMGKGSGGYAPSRGVQGQIPRWERWRSGGAPQY